MLPLPHPLHPAETKWIVHVDKSLKCRPADGQQYWKNPSIYKFPAFITNLNYKAYQLQVVSFSPYHCGKVHLRQMEEHKHRVLVHFLGRSGKSLKCFLCSLIKVAHNLEERYDTLDLKWKEGGGGRFLELMIMDGCFMLKIMRTTIEEKHGYAPNDPTFSTSRLAYLKANQLPMLVLYEMVAIESDYTMTEQIILSATELNETGIQFQKTPTSSLKNISFARGLTLPVIKVDGTTESAFLNLMTFERLHIEAGNEITAYVTFMDNIINNEQDNGVGSDKAVAKLFNSLCKEVPLASNKSLDVVQKNISKYCEKPWHMWRANLNRAYFKSPRSILSLIAAIFLFALTIVQTVYSVLSYN
ncbi:hypothetical protein EUGRSUZ_J01678 [Eucalyptus grandis]|uniref:Uncharacterized protein n=2 Tax=Eucalyptus grandis TaxID=71139 RepID=A0A059AFU1_EUCGR|nr:hypothetical protein EUGRSUZ_J01678 [Eucalyptus grandis]